LELRDNFAEVSQAWRRRLFTRKLRYTDFAPAKIQQPRRVIIRRMSARARARAREGWQGETPAVSTMSR
jgi:hypothetical protein